MPDKHRTPLHTPAAQNNLLRTVTGSFSGATTLEPLADNAMFHNMISRNPSMIRLFGMIKDIAASNASVFLSGESGTGKELFARAIHELSARSKSPLITINCGSMPETLLESEIFGIRKGGAFAAATENRPGRLEMCYGGTFFLNEVGDLPLSLQTKLLRVLENHEFQPLGGRTPIKTDVRFISASHRTIENMVAEGTFRQDLFFRLNTVALTIPPLRERREDIHLLLDMAIGRFNNLYNKQVTSVATEVLELLAHHPFPGNVRELLNIAEQSVILCHGSEITVEHLPSSLQGRNQVSSTYMQRSSKMPSATELQNLFSRYNGNRGEIAKQLNVDRTTLWRWMKRMGVKLTSRQKLPHLSS